MAGGVTVAVEVEARAVGQGSGPAHGFSVPEGFQKGLDILLVEHPVGQRTGGVFLLAASHVEQAQAQA
ncbi:hypothetical protein ARNL5_03737 [Anaerolineae bacterium]|nr:hypothetical protein ARNL5_03737 [Anaerolineae bacterium]